MRQWFRFWSTPDAIGPQLVARLEANWPQAVAKTGFRRKPIVQQLVAQIPWGHNSALLEKLRDPADAMFYVQKTIENNWSRAVLAHQIESGLHLREGKAIENFEATLPKPESDLARPRRRSIVPGLSNHRGTEKHGGNLLRRMCALLYLCGFASRFSTRMPLMPPSFASMKDRFKEPWQDKISRLLLLSSRFSGGLEPFRDDAGRSTQVHQRAAFHACWFLDAQTESIAFCLGAAILLGFRLKR